MFTVSDNAADVLAKSFASPAYPAVIECVPAARDEVWNVATALVVPAAFNVPVPNCTPPSKNATVPVGAVVPVAVTTAVNVTGVPWTEGFTLDATVVPVFCSTT
jgi:hypothetical protein